MKKRKVIRNIPARVPVANTILYSFLLYYFKVSQLWVGIFIAVYSIYWIICILLVFTEDRVDITEFFKPEEQKQTFADKLKEIVKNRQK